jgi:DNA-directed RNA polymerase specialized sigma24 family protein
VAHVSLNNAAMVGEEAAHRRGHARRCHALARFDPRKVRVVEMRFFGGLSVDETAAVLNVSPVTLMRDWSSAKARCAKILVS